MADDSEVTLRPGKPDAKACGSGIQIPAGAISQMEIFFDYLRENVRKEGISEKLQ